MDNLVLRRDNPLWFVEESEELMEYSEGDLASQIFRYVDTRLNKEQKSLISSIVESVPAVAELTKGLRKNQTLKLVFSDEVKKKIEDGTYHLMKKKDADGVFKAVVVDGRNKTKAIADLKWEDVSQGVDSARFTSAMQGMAIQQQLRDISEQLEDMSAAMEEVLIGQHNDRIAMYLSGEAIIREALSTSSPELKKALTSSAILALTNATALLQASLPGEIRSVVDKYDSDKGRFVGIKSEKLQETMFLINSAFHTIHKATTLKAAIYYEQGEYSALTTVLSDYKAFLERSLPEQDAHVLFLADPHEKNIEGTWNIRQNELPKKIDRTKELLSKPAEFALEAKKEDLK